MTLFAAYLHVLFFVSAGGLWRDEAGFVYLSLLPSFSKVWQTLPYDHCPILMPLAVRAWSATGFGNTDPGLRVFRAPSWRWNQLDDELRRTDKGSVGKGIDLKEGATHQLASGTAKSTACTVNKITERMIVNRKQNGFS